MMERLNYAQRDGLIRDLQFAYGEAKARLGGASLSIYSDVEEQIEAIREQRALVLAIHELLDAIDYPDQTGSHGRNLRGEVNTMMFTLRHLR